MPSMFLKIKKIKKLKYLFFLFKHKVHCASSYLPWYVSLNPCLFSE